MLTKLILLALSLGLIGSVRAQNLSGRVLLSDTVAAPYATIYLPALGQGTVTDGNGYYWLENLPAGNFEVEFSHLGYRTVKRSLVISSISDTTHDETLQEQPIALNEVYVTPTGEDPAIYILNKVAERAVANRRQLQYYEATMGYIFQSDNLDLLTTSVPKPVLWIARTALRARNRGAIFEFCLDHKAVDARLSSDLCYDHGKTTYSHEIVLSSTPAMSDKASAQLFRSTHKDLYDILYSTSADYSTKALKKGKCKYQLKGTVEENGLVIDVLENPHSKDNSNEGPRTLYVVEGDWGILRMEHKGSEVYERIECRNVEGVYLPVSRVLKNAFSSLDEFLKQGEPHPSMATGVSINYSEVAVSAY